MSLKVEGMDKVINWMETFEDRLEAVIKERFDDIGAGYIEEVRDDQMSGRPGLDQRTGTLANSLVALVEYRNSDITGVVGTNVDYVYAHEYGTKFIPKRLTMRDLFVQDYEPQYGKAVEEAIQEVIDG